VPGRRSVHSTPTRYIFLYFLLGEAHLGVSHCCGLAQ